MISINKRYLCILNHCYLVSWFATLIQKYCIFFNSQNFSQESNKLLVGLSLFRGCSNGNSSKLLIYFHYFAHFAIGFCFNDNSKSLGSRYETFRCILLLYLLRGLFSFLAFHCYLIIYQKTEMKKYPFQWNPLENSLNSYQKSTLADIKIESKAG